MPTLNINGCDYFYEIHGSGKETIVFSHGLLWSSKMFYKQVAHLQDRYRIITYDHRGQGQSQVTEKGYDMDQLYEDAAQLIEKLDLGKVHFAGLSMGGFVAMRLAARRPDLVRSMILMETTAEDEPNQLKYRFLTAIVKLFGVNIVTGPVMKIMFGQKFLNDPDRKEEREEWTRELQKNQKSIVSAVEGVIYRKGIEAELEKITCPTLVMVGTQDVATVPAKAEYIHAQIPHSILKYIEGAGHTSSIEEAEQINREIDRFLGRI